MMTRLSHRYVNIDGVRTHYVIEGRGKPLVLVHGWGGSWEEWKYNIPELSKHFRVIALDLPGFGDSEELNKHSLDNLLSFLDSFFDKLNIEKFNLMSHSMGAILSFKYALKHPERVEKIVLIGMPLYFPGLWGLLRFLINALNDRTKTWIAEKILKSTYFILLSYKQSLFYELNPKWFNDIQEMKSKASIKAFLEISEDLIHLNLIPYLRGLKKPALIIRGEKDMFGHEPSLYSRIPNSKVITIPKTKHCMLMERPEEFNKLVLDFLR